MASYPLRYSDFTHADRKDTTARQAEAVLWTQDADFEGLPGVKFRAKKGVARPG